MLEKPFKAARVSFYEIHLVSGFFISEEPDRDRMEFLMTFVNQHVLLPPGRLISYIQSFVSAFSRSAFVLLAFSTHQSFLLSDL